MTLRYLRIFKEVCEQQSVTKAAKKLFISQPSVSVVISDMEKKYNVKLFTRIHNRLVITEEGRELYAKACNVLNNFDDFEALAFENGNANCVKIGTSLTIGTFFLPALAKKIQRAYPQAQLKIKIFPKDKIENLLLRGELDFALVENASQSAELINKKFFEDKLVAVCAPDFSAPVQLNLQQLKALPLIFREKGSATRDFFDNFAKQCGIDLFPFIETANPQAAVNCAKAGLGVTVLPMSMVQENITNGSLRTIDLIDVNLKRFYYFAVHRQKVFAPLQKNVFDLCEQYFRFESPACSNSDRKKDYAGF